MYIYGQAQHEGLSFGFGNEVISKRKRQLFTLPSAVNNALDPANHKDKDKVNNARKEFEIEEEEASRIFSNIPDKDQSSERPRKILLK